MAGGVAGRSYSTTIYRCSSLGVIISNGHNGIERSGYIGGILGGDGNSSIINCFFNGILIGNGTIGGIIGGALNYDGGISEIIDSYSIGEISGYGDRIGGLVGGMYGINVIRTFSAVTINSSHNDPIIGGIGTFYYGENLLSYNYWDINTSGQPYATPGYTPPTNYGLPTLEMKNIQNYLNSGWDFNEVWGINPDFNDGYPFLRAIYPDVPTNDIDEVILELVPAKLYGNYPNPFNPETTINFSLSVESLLRIDIYNIKGQRVKSLVDDIYRPGEYSVIWNGKDDRGNELSSGAYFYRMQAGEYGSVKRMMLLK